MLYHGASPHIFFSCFTSFSELRNFFCKDTNIVDAKLHITVINKVDSYMLLTILLLSEIIATLVSQQFVSALDNDHVIFKMFLIWY